MHWIGRRTGRWTALLLLLALAAGAPGGEELSLRSKLKLL